MRRALATIVVLAIAGAIGYAFMPAVIPVDLATVSVGPLEVTVRDEGKTRIREQYVVSSPLAGRVLRIELDPGDVVDAAKTILATIEPSDPSLLDARALAQSQANVKAAESRLQRAHVELKLAEAGLEWAQSNFSRIRSLRESQSTSKDEFEDAELTLRTRSEQLEAAKFNISIANFELEQSKAALLRFRRVNGASEKPSSASASIDAASIDEIDTEYRMEIRSPINGRVLRVFQESSAVITPGAPLVEIGDPSDLEIVVDVISEDAVKIKPGNVARIEQWGGGNSLDANVRLIEPQAFTKISALGVEEQRVNIILDFESATTETAVLGDGFRVEADIVVWNGADIVKAPVSTLFRKDDKWAVFVVEKGIARLKLIDIGQKNSEEAQVITGLAPGEILIVHPGDNIQEGTAVRPRS